MTTLQPAKSDEAEFRGEALALRSIFGGLLMGLANLVPGISGGTMLLVTGVYPQFINGVAEISTFRFRPKVLLTLFLIVAAAALAIVGGARVVSMLVIEHRWIMYSLFIGLTLGGVPVLWRMAKPADSMIIIASLIGLAAMALLAIFQPGEVGQTTGGPGQYAMLLLAGAAGGSAMILPGISGAYLLLVLGQYLIILTAIDQARAALSAQDLQLLIDALKIIIPVGVGVVLGIVGVSNIMKILLEKHPRPTVGVLLGLLIGAVFGLWPFQQPVQPAIGDIIKGDQITSLEMAQEIQPQDWPTAHFTPTPLQIGASLALIGIGFATSILIARIGNNGNNNAATQTNDARN